MVRRQGLKWPSRHDRNEQGKKKQHGQKESDRRTSQKPCGALDQHSLSPPPAPSATPHTRPHPPPCSGKIFWLRSTQPNQNPHGTHSHAPTPTNAPPTTHKTTHNGLCLTDKKAKKTRCRCEARAPPPRRARCRTQLREQEEARHHHPCAPKRTS